MLWTNTSTLPKGGFSGLRQNLKSDLIAGFSVALVALPLGLGVAIASGAPPVAGLISSIVGGILTTFLRGSYVAINGAGAGMIVVVVSAQ